MRLNHAVHFVRRTILKEDSLSYKKNSVSSQHMSKDCREQVKCTQCGRSHNTLMHRDYVTRPSTVHAGEKKM